MVAVALGCSSLQASAASWPAACGPDGAQFRVKTEKKAADVGAPAQDKARVVLVQELDGDFGSAPITRFAIDGTWLGADKGGSYFTLEIPPGIHELCASRQSGVRLEKDNMATAKQNFEAGKVYFYNFKIKRTITGSPEMRTTGSGVPGSSMTAKDAPTLDTADLQPLNVDAGSSLIKRLPQSISQAK